MLWNFEDRDPFWDSSCSAVSTPESVMIDTRKTNSPNKSLGIFSKLPQEIREEIWGLVLDFKTSDTAVQRKRHNALLWVSSQIRSEALPMLYRTNTFCLSHLDVRYQKTWSGSIVKTYSVHSLGIVTASGVATYGCSPALPSPNYLKLVKHVEVNMRFSNVNWGDRDSEIIDDTFISPTPIIDGNHTNMWESVRLQVLKGASVAVRCEEVKELLRGLSKLKTLSIVARSHFEHENRERVNIEVVEALLELKDVNAENIGVKIQFMRNGEWTEGIAVKNGEWVDGLRSLQERQIRENVSFG